MKVISHDELKDMMDNQDIVIVEVLPAESFEQFHLPGAVNVPLDENFRDEIQRVVPDKQQQVVVYCANQQCQASPKAAQAMEELGYQNVYDYEMGKADWVESHMPVEK